MGALPEVKCNLTAIVLKCESDDFDYPPWVMGSIPILPKGR